MLSRTADHLFWMARYMERAENTARMLDVNYQTSLLPQSADMAEQGWRGLLSISELTESYQQKHHGVSAAQVMDFMVRDEKNPSSILSCVRAARENARAVRGGLLDVEHDERGVDGRLEVQQARLGPERGLPRLGPARVHERVRPAETLLAPLEQRLRAAVARVDAHDVVAGAQQREEHGRDRAHAGGKQQRALGAFEVREALLGGGDGRVPLALVERAGRALLLRLDHVVEAVERERGAVHDGRAHLAGVLGVRAVDGVRLQRKAGLGARGGHVGLPAGGG